MSEEIPPHVEGETLVQAILDTVAELESQGIELSDEQKHEIAQQKTLEVNSTTEENLVTPPIYIQHLGQHSELQ